MITAWIDEKKLDDHLQDFRKQFLGGVETFAGKSLRPFFWNQGEQRHVFGLDSLMVFLGAIEILVLTDLEKHKMQGNPIIFCGSYDERKPIILFGEQAKHVIQSFNFVHVETDHFEYRLALINVKRNTPIL